jgi:replicative DNA helicase
LATTDYNIDRGLPSAVDAERSILGAILLDAHSYNQAAESLHPDDFSLDSHRRIFLRMMDLDATGRPIDIITLQEELSRNKELESIGGVAYLASLTDGVPRRPSIEHYVKMVRDKALLRGLINAANGAIASAFEQSEPAEEILDAAEAAIFQVSDKRLGRGFLTIPQIVQDSFGSPDALTAPSAHITGLETHFKLFDEKTRGLQKSDLIIVAARPSMGKTAFALNVAENVAVHDKKVVAIFSLEMSREALLRRLLFSHARVDAHKMSSGFIGKDDTRKLATALNSLYEAPIFIDDTPGMSVHEMRAKARRLKQQQQNVLDLIVVDYLQLMAATALGGKRFENRTQEVSAISRGLKALAKELNVPVIAVSQLSRAPESRGGDHRPQLSDLRESGSIEQDADVVAFLFREEYYMKHEDAEAKGLDGIAELIIGKQRNGPTGSIPLVFLKNFTCFENKAEDRYNAIDGQEF